MHDEFTFKLRFLIDTKLQYANDDLSCIQVTTA